MIILGTSDAWSTGHLSHRTSKPAYYIVDCRIYILILLQIYLVSLYFIFLSLRLHLTHLWTDKEFPYCVLKKLVKSISFPFAEFLMAIMVSKVLPSYSLLCTFFSSLRPEWLTLLLWGTQLAAAAAWILSLVG